MWCKPCMCMCVRTAKRLRIFKGFEYLYSNCKWISDVLLPYRLWCRHSFGGARDRAQHFIVISLLNHRLNAIYQSLRSLFNCSVHSQHKRNDDTNNNNNSKKIVRIAAVESHTYTPQIILAETYTWKICLLHSYRIPFGIFLLFFCCGFTKYSSIHRRNTYMTHECYGFSFGSLFVNVSIPFHKPAILSAHSSVCSLNSFNCCCGVSECRQNKNITKPIYSAKIVCTISTRCIHTTLV